MMRYSIRPAAIGDAAVIAHHRVAMFQDMGDVPTAAMSTELLSASIPALSVLLREGSYVGWLAIDTDERVIAGAGVHVRPQLPRISQDGGRVVATPVPLVVNVYTEPAWRRKGIARALMQELMDWSVVQGFDRLLLHASEAGRDLYLSLGFGPSNEMRWPPKHGDFTPSSER